MGESEGGAVVGNVREALATRLPGIIVWQEAEPRRTRLIFPAASGADYRIVALVRRDGSRAEVLAELVSDPELRFWSRRLNASDDIDLAGALTDLLVPLLSRPTLVRQSRALLTWRFTCEFPADDGLMAVHGRRVLRLPGSAPPAPGGERVYRAPGTKRRAR